MSRARIFERHERFSANRTEVEEDELPGRLMTAITEGKVHKIIEILRIDDRRHGKHSQRSIRTILA